MITILKWVRSEIKKALIFMSAFLNFLQ